MPSFRKQITEIKGEGMIAGYLTGNAANQRRHHMYPLNRFICPFCSIPEEHNVHDEYTIFAPFQRKFKAVSDSGFQAVDSGLQVVDFLSVKLGFRIPKLWIPDSKSKISRVNLEKYIDI